MSTDDQHALERTTAEAFALGAGRSYRCHVAVIPEAEGDFSAIVLNLPGIGSGGDTAEEALINVHDAVKTALEAYDSLQMPIPWRSTSESDVPAGAQATWIVVDA
jgi:predicted RNase H-like HicB family nuclease